MAVAAYTDQFNEAIDDLATTLGAVTGLQVITDPRNITPGVGCVLIGAPSFTAWNYNITKLVFPVQVIGSGPSNLDALRTILNACWKVLNANVAVTGGNPITLEIGSSILPAYELSIAMQAQTA